MTDYGADSAISIYYAEFPERLPEKTWVAMLAALPAAVRDKAAAASRWEDAHAIVISRILLQKALIEQGGSGDLGALEFTGFGRPFLAGGPDFNWSHSGNMAVCAISRYSAVGIDIERIRPLELPDFKDLFPAWEWARITGSRDPQGMFFEAWTCREAILKADGRGLSGKISDIVKIGGGEARLGNEPWWTCKIDLWRDYACSLASKAMSPQLLYHQVII